MEETIGQLFGRLRVQLCDPIEQGSLSPILQLIPEVLLALATTETRSSITLTTRLRFSFEGVGDVYFAGRIFPAIFAAGISRRGHRAQRIAGYERSADHRLGTQRDLSIADLPGRFTHENAAVQARRAGIDPQ